MQHDVVEVPVSTIEDPDRLLAIARENAEALWTRARRLHAGAGERIYARLRSAPDHDVWVIVWGTGSGIELHDHGGSAGAFAVARGSLIDTDEDEDGRRAIREVRCGRGRCLDPDVRHAVRNASDAPTVSVHVYSPPLTTMRFYDEPDSPREEHVDEGTVTSRRREVR